ncbi:MAG: hypothetical protein E4H14_00785 [Candidatus Thorarchaeota archaeon]|nr:MAG: hypothetical protein E4H14_00785 [Candidatus Thorarchaeota archaeon]
MQSIIDRLEIEQALKKRVKWTTVLPADPRKHLIQSEEPFTVYGTLVDLLDFPKTHSIVKEVRKSLLADDRIQDLVQNLPTDWASYLVKGHQKADYPPSILLLLFDFGIEKKDFPQIVSLLDQMMNLQDEEGRFQSLAMFPRSKPMIGSSLCDTHIITENLLFGGYDGTEEIQKAIDFIGLQLKETSQGLAWKCEPNSASKARGPGRKDDICPQVTLEALRLFSHLPKKKRPGELIETGRTLLSCYERSKDHRPYMFGHGSRFKKLRPPFFWYDIGAVLDATSRYSELTQESAFQDMLSIIISKADENGRFTPESIYLPFKNWSYGQKKVWSPWLTLYISRILKRVYR